MRDNNAYVLNGFSPAIMKLLADSFCRHSIDLTTLSYRLRLMAPEMARSEAQARDLAALCMFVDTLSERVATDALRALTEARKLGSMGAAVTVCKCGRGIESGDCPTGGRCYRGLEISLHA